MTNTEHIEQLYVFAVYMLGSREQAFAAVDQQVIRRVDLYDEAGGRAFTAFEYGAGDNSYGAIFVAGTKTRAASIVASLRPGPSAPTTKPMLRRLARRNS